MTRAVLALLSVALALDAAATGSVTLSADIVDPTDGISQPPPDILCIDVLADVSGPGAWTVGALRGVALNGATYVYALDPNCPECGLVNPGLNQRFVTFLSRPRGRDADDRYTNGQAAVAGRYCPTGPSATTTSSECNIVFFGSPPATTGTPAEDGAILRVALHLPPGVPQASCVALPFDQNPPPLTPLLLSTCDDGRLGTVSATYANPALVGMNWGVFVIPEPPALAILALPAITLLTQRRRR